MTAASTTPRIKRIAASAGILCTILVSEAQAPHRIRQMKISFRTLRRSRKSPLDLEEEIAEEEKCAKKRRDAFGNAQIFRNAHAEAKLKFARSRYAVLYADKHTIGMMYHQRFVALVELFIGLPLKLRLA